jgi:hypothetical protein
MTALLFTLKMRDFHPPPEDCRHLGNVIYSQTGILRKARTLRFSDVGINASFNP